jgi:hypothetical protein
MSILSDTLTPILAIISYVLDYFVAGNQLTERGNFIAGSLTDIVQSIAEFSTHLDVLLGNHL